MPSFARRVSYYEIYSSSFHLMVWKLLYGVDSDHELRYEMEAECYISITKMLKYDYKVVKD